MGFDRSMASYVSRRSIGAGLPQTSCAPNPSRQRTNQPSALRHADGTAGMDNPAAEPKSLVNQYQE